MSAMQADLIEDLAQALEEAIVLLQKDFSDPDQVAAINRCQRALEQYHALELAKKLNESR